MAIGCDQLFAILAIENDIRLIAAVPFIGQEKIWPESSKLLYREILEHPNTEVVVVSEGGYSPQKMQVRNEWMVDRSDIMIAIWDGTNGGTGNCVKYIKKCKKELIIINPQNYQI